MCAFLTLWWEGPAEVRDLSLPQPPLVSSHRLARDIAAAGVCFGGRVVWAVEEQSGWQPGARVSSVWGGRPGLIDPACLQPCTIS